MAKISPVSIKYTIYAKFEAVGAVEKPDVIGALFGQTEGLLGSELEMRELQKEGKIGRIEVNLESQNGKTIGKIEIPSALDKAETTIIAAAIETIERIGPTDAKIEIEKIEDVRGNKREYIIERAKKLLEQIEGSMPESREMADTVKISARVSKLQEYGKEKLPSGDISGNEVIVVEGRADVINLLRNGVNNVIAMNGTILPETIKELSYDKEITLFIDGDRGGKLIAKNAIDNARVNFVASAPDGKEVEELTGKEILVSLRKKIPAGEFFLGRERTGERYRRFSYREETPAEETEEVKEITLDKKQKDKLREMMEDIRGTKSAFLLDENLEQIRKVSSSSLRQALFRSRKKASVIVMDGTVTSGIVESAENSGVQYIAAKNFACGESKVKLISL